jgi:cytochrome c oxidase subunit 4
MALLTLLALTIFGGYLKLGGINLFLSVAIAALKAAIIIVIFMKPARELRLGWAFSLGGIFFLLIMLGLTGADYFTRAQDLVR